MSKRESGAIRFEDHGKKLRMSNGAAEPTELDEALHSRQIAVYGRESMRKLASASVLVIGAGALGIEVAKNVVLAGVKGLTLMDTNVVTIKDLSAQFYLTQDDIGKTKATACVDRLQELNTAVNVNVSDAVVTAETLREWNIVVMTNGSLSEAQRVDALCHSHSPPIPFIYSEIRGLFASVFTDFGPAFDVTDVDGVDPYSGIVADIRPGNPTLVSCVDDERLEFEDGMFVTFAEVKGMEALNTAGPISIGKCQKHSFQLDLDTTDYGTYDTGGIVTQVKQPKTLCFKPLEVALQEPGEFLHSDFSKFGRPAMLHVAFQGLEKFRMAHRRFPAPGSTSDADMLFQLAEGVNGEAAEKVELDRALLQHFASGASAELNPMAALFGGFVGQEVVKAASGKFHPLYQFLYFDSLECLPETPLTEAEVQPTGSRYDDQISVFGATLQKQLSELNLFLVGAGALGCEYLKNFAMMGIACGANGCVTVTDDDVIEKSNLSRQFLFRDWNIRSSKSTVAAEATLKLNPSIKITARQDRVAPNTEHIFHDDFWQGLDLVVNALDNVNARLYVDARCVYFRKPLLESGTLGPKCSTQDVVPFVTENYGASQDPPEREAPMCTLHSFPHNIHHCLAWARSEFEGIFEKAPSDANSFLQDTEKYKANLERQRDASARDKLEHVVQALTTDLCQDFEACVRAARLKFESYFHDKIAQLVYTFPKDNVTSNGARFWSPPKRFPTALSFDASDAAHCSLIQAMAILTAEIYHVRLPEWASDAAKVGAVAGEFVIPEFVPKSGVYIETDPAADKEPRGSMLDESAEIERLWEQLLKLKSTFPEGYQLEPIVFEKDDDDNFHMDAIAGLANMRARNYSIGEVDKLKAKLIAGRIIPAIATTTAMATGLACLELLKVIQKKKIEAYRNAFANLALPMISMAEPMPAKEYKFSDLKWTLWDRWELQGNLTVQDVIDYFREKKLECYSISAGASLLYNNMFPKHASRLQTRLSELIVSVGKQTIPDYRRHFDVVVACEDENGEDLDVPLVSIYFR